MDGHLSWLQSLTGRPRIPASAQERGSPLPKWGRKRTRSSERAGLPAGVREAGLKAAPASSPPQAPPRDAPVSNRELSPGLPLLTPGVWTGSHLWTASIPPASELLSGLRSKENSELSIIHTMGCYTLGHPNKEKVQGPPSTTSVFWRPQTHKKRWRNNLILFIPSPSSFNSPEKPPMPEPSQLYGVSATPYNSPYSSLSRPELMAPTPPFSCSGTSGPSPLELSAQGQWSIIFFERWVKNKNLIQKTYTVA